MLEFPTTPFDKRLLAPTIIIKNEIERHLGHVGKITDRAKPGNDNGGLLSSDQKQRVASN
ncbi:uncharacterized protein EAE98_003351 [Botrytis deweyae]|uniref:Uncharacterized protein n=1 Tax=Botrytis deweyae TaxID=2478750 RepID=A0ABQ7ITL9_9HELO|nr:uncharacterized protein EAE98_003351 [Botrytis deweyae]KAF7933642.1 hypothetical protein EAE98_003351 [Botrytis deweyae]